MKTSYRVLQFNSNDKLLSVIEDLVSELNTRLPDDMTLEWGYSDWDKHGNPKGFAIDLAVTD